MYQRFISIVHIHRYFFNLYSGNTGNVIIESVKGTNIFSIMTITYRRFVRSSAESRSYRGRTTTLTFSSFEFLQKCFSFLPMFIINSLNLYPLSKIGFHFPPHTFYVSSQHIMIQLILYVEPGEVIEAFVCRKILPEGFEAHPVRIDQRKGIMPVVACAG